MQVVRARQVVRKCTTGWGMSQRGNCRDDIRREIHAEGGRAPILWFVTEIPEHLLKRSRERRAAIGQGGDDAPAEAASTDAAPSNAVETTAAAAPAATMISINTTSTVLDGSQFGQLSSDVHDFVRAAATPTASWNA